MDHDDRALFVDRVLTGGVSLEAYARGDYQPVRSWARVPAAYEVERSGDAVEMRCSLPADARVGQLAKTLRFDPGWRGSRRATGGNPLGSDQDLFTTELSLFRPLDFAFEPEPDIWVFPVETVAKSERGLDRTLQGESVTLRWPLALGAARVEIVAPVLGSR